MPQIAYMRSCVFMALLYQKIRDCAKCEKIQHRWKHLLTSPNYTWYNWRLKMRNKSSHFWLETKVLNIFYAKFARLRLLLGIF